VRKTLGFVAALLVATLCLTGGAFARDKEVTLVDFSWNSVQMHNRIAGFILQHGYGYTPEYLFAESEPGSKA